MPTETDRDPLRKLQVLDRLEIGPVEIERDRLIAPYRLTIGRATDKVDLIYRYQEPVFDPEDPSSRNLATMVGAQVALNYGLFCRQISFRGALDDVDRRFLIDMAENTAREIYVKKFLEPNPFLVGEVAAPPAIRHRRYSQAEMVFPDARTNERPGPWQLWPTRSDRHAVLSSGGKDSLLTYGLLHELERETHPVFVNESGRHWLTALNAFRHFRTHIPNTARVWVNSDRVFAWFLRRLPFIRPDFSDVRSDEYPIRLWTVAVFLFGSLPILRRRGIGRLLIGDEFDTTVRASHAGITHYDGLYDQSRYFDAALSRYFLRKGWAVAQFSILRPLSELLIQKTLVERYPELQAQQMSCHAAHVEGNRVRPCGRCEKCRRIVGMLMAIEADPTACGYSPEQIEHCLRALADRGVHQEAAGARQLYHLLRERGLVELPAARRRWARPHPEILKLRFDAERAPLDGFPTDLRDGVFRLVLAHADGAAIRRERRWHDYDPLADPALAKPFAFETGGDQTGANAAPAADGAATDVATGGVLWGELTWPDAEERLGRVDVALLPVGSVEQHGPHLPLDTDAFDADYLSRRVAEACSDPKPLVLPAVYYGVSYQHDDFKGTISVSNDSLAALVYDIGMSAARNGVRKLVIVNGHGGNAPALNNAAQRINRDARIFVCVDTGETSDIDIDRMIETANDVHAGEIETSTTLALRPHLVRSERIRKVVPRFTNRYLSFTSRRGVAWYAHTRRLSPSGVMGDPTRATAEKGERIWQVMIAHLTALTEGLKAMTLDEIYQRRY